jgi:iron complex transport system substrate-binding protein
MSRVLAVALLAAMLLVAGCGERREPTGASVELFPVTVQDAAGKTLRVETRPARIASLTSAGTEILAALGAGNRVVGIPAPARHGAAPKAVEIVDKDGRINERRLARLRPQLIVASPELGPTRLRRAAARLRAHVYVAPGSSLRDVERAVSDVGLLTGEPIAARRIIAGLETTQRQVTRKVAGTPTISVFVDTGFFTTVAARSLAGKLISLAHGHNVAGPTPNPEPLDPAQLVRLDPRVYIATSTSHTTLASLRKDKVTKRLRAVRDGRFVIIPTVLLEPSPRAREGLVAIARALHPRAFR